MKTLKTIAQTIWAIGIVASILFGMFSMPKQVAEGVLTPILYAGLVFGGGGFLWYFVYRAIDLWQPNRKEKKTKGVGTLN